MFFSRVASLAAFGALAGSVVAQGDFKILSPGGPDLWWVAQSQNTIVWTCQNAPAQTYELLIANTNVDILVAPSAIIAGIPNADCSHTVTQQQTLLTPATGYTLILANPINATEIYATSQEFEVKALGATYPAASATPTAGGSTSSGSSSPSGSPSNSSDASSPSGTPGAAAGLHNSAVMGAGALGVVAAAFGLL